MAETSTDRRKCQERARARKALPSVDRPPQGAKSRCDSSHENARKGREAQRPRRESAPGVFEFERESQIRTIAPALRQPYGGDIEAAARLAGHADTRTTQLYSRKNRQVSSIEVERVQL